jgi:hypothetical protein
MELLAAEMWRRLRRMRHRDGNALNARENSALRSFAVQAHAFILYA